MSYIAVILIKIYQSVVSPLLPGECRFYPSCSQYGIEAFQKHGFLKGAYLTVMRILRCNPYCKCGYDPVPEKNHRAHKLQINKS